MPLTKYLKICASGGFCKGSRRVSLPKYLRIGVSGGFCQESLGVSLLEYLQIGACQARIYYGFTKDLLR